jgi:tRNA G18 (ribose-2'-O)-methylase SpoU
VGAPIEVTDARDPRLADFRDLTDADVRPDRRGVVIAEGAAVVARMIDSPYRVRAVVGVPSRIEALKPQLAALNAPVYVVDKWLLSAVVGFRVTRGMLAAADRPPAAALDEVLRDARRIAFLEGLNDFENIGALFRNAAAFGLDALLLDARCADPLYRRSVRVSMGHVLRVPFAVLPAGRRDGGAATGVRQLTERGFSTIALTPSADAVDLRTLDIAPRWAVLVGAEGPGLTPETQCAATVRARIPMAAGVDSLNVATAAAVAFAILR